MKEKKPTPLLQKIFDLRRSKRISLDALGKVMGGITPEGASKVENGDVPLKAEYLPAIAKLLDVQAWEFFTDYKAGDFGLLSPEEKSLLLNFRVAEEESRKAIQLVAKQVKKK